MLKDLVGANIYNLIGREETISEIRMRISRPLVVGYLDGTRKSIFEGGAQYIVSQKDIDDVLAFATNRSLYSASDEMKMGYIPCDKYRIGVGGEGVFDGDNFISVKNICYLTIRIPHQIFGVADRIIDDIFAIDKVRNTLIISPTGGGKTTMLRELARIASRGRNVTVIDERYELCATSDGVPTLDIGDADVMSGVPKRIAYQNCVRAMNPDIIVTDELFDERDVRAICDVIRCGVAVFASLHGDSVKSVCKSKIYAPLFDVFDCAVVLSKSPVGSIREKVLL